MVGFDSNNLNYLTWECDVRRELVLRYMVGIKVYRRNDISIYSVLYVDV